MVIYFQPRPGSETSRCIGESGSWGRPIRGAHPARTSTGSIKTDTRGPATVVLYLSDCPAETTIYLEHP